MSKEKTIYVYRHNMTEVGGGKFQMKMKRGAKVLSVGVQGSQLCVWAEVDILAGDVWKGFAGFLTGQIIDHAEVGKLRFVGTVQMALVSSFFVVHVYEVM